MFAVVGWVVSLDKHQLKQPTSWITFPHRGGKEITPIPPLLWHHFISIKKNNSSQISSVTQHPSHMYLILKCFHWFKMHFARTSLTVQWIRLCASNAEFDPWSGNWDPTCCAVRPKQTFLTEKIKIKSTLQVNCLSKQFHYKLITMVKIINKFHPVLKQRTGFISVLFSTLWSTEHLKIRSLSKTIGIMSKVYKY